MMVIEGNHEIEPQVDGITFKSYTTRFAVPSEESGSNSSFYYSFNAGGIHFVMLGAYVDYNHTGAYFNPYIGHDQFAHYWKQSLVRPLVCSTY